MKLTLLLCPFLAHLIHHSKMEIMGAKQTAHLLPVSHSLDIKHYFIKVITDLHLVRRFWNQVFTWASVILSSLARAARSADARYFCLWNRFSNSHTCNLFIRMKAFNCLASSPAVAFYNEKLRANWYYAIHSILQKRNIGDVSSSFFNGFLTSSWLSALKSDEEK